MKTKRTSFTTLFVVFFCTIGMAKNTPHPAWKMLIPGDHGPLSINSFKRNLHGLQKTLLGEAGMPNTASPAVNFLSFAGKAQNKQVPLSWTIIALKQIERFEIERSDDNSSYSSVGTVVKEVKLNEAVCFDFTDDISNTNTGIIYYRLKVIDKTGAIKYSMVRVVRQAEPAAGFILMYDALTGYTIKYPSEESMKITVKVWDESGKPVLTKKQKVIKGINLVRLQKLNKCNPGVYTVQVCCGNKTTTQTLYK